jgi:uncharacterized protein (TIRG00374 family)
MATETGQTESARAENLQMEAAQSDAAGSTIAPTAKRKFWKTPYFRYSVSILVLLVLLKFIPFHKVLDTMKSVPPGVAVAALVFYLLVHLVGVEKWRMMINLAGAGVSFPQALRCYYWGLFGNIFLPSLVGGDLVRAGMAFFFAKSKPAVVLGSLMDRMQDMGSLLAVTLIGVALIPGNTDARTRNILWITAGFLVAVSLVGAAVLFLVPVKRFSFKRRRTLVKVRHGARSMWRKPQTMILAFTFGMVLQAGLTAINWWLGDATGLHVSLAAWLFAWPLAKLTSLFGFTQGGLGVREATLVFLLMPFGAPGVKTLAVGLAFQAVLMTGGLIAGGIAMAMGRLEGLKTA